MDDPSTMRIVSDPGRGARVDRRRVALDLGDGRGTTADVYRPAEAPHGVALPFVLFVPGDAPQAVLDGLLDWGQYRSWGEAVAARGLAAVVASHRSSDELRRAADVLAEVRATLDAIRRDAAALGVDAGRAAVWTASGGASFGAIAALLAEPAVDALVVYYGLLDLRGYAAHLGTLGPDAAAAVSAPEVAGRLAAVPPTLLVTAGNDHPGMTDTADDFARAVAGKGELRRLHHPTGRHAFDILDDDAATAEIIGATLEFLVERLGPRGPDGAGRMAS